MLVIRQPVFSTRLGNVYVVSTVVKSRVGSCLRALQSIIYFRDRHFTLTWVSTDISTTEPIYYVRYSENIATYS